jgi:hypothetical protein
MKIYLINIPLFTDGSLLFAICIDIYMRFVIKKRYIFLVKYLDSRYSNVAKARGHHDADQYCIVQVCLKDSGTTHFASL